MTKTPAHRGKTCSDAEFRRLWASAMTLAEIGAILGISGSAVSARAKSRELGRRPKGMGPSATPVDATLFRDMWNAGVAYPVLSARFGVCERTIRTIARRLALAARPLGAAPISLAEWRAQRVAAELKRAAAGEEAQVMLAEMADRVDGRWVGTR